MNNGSSARLPEADDDLSSMSHVVDDSNDITITYDESEIQKMILKKRSLKLRELFTALEFLTYVQLAALYYLDNLTLLFLLRSSVQRIAIISLSLPGTSNILALPPALSQALGHTTGQSSSQLAVMLSATLFGLLLHQLMSPPTAGEPTRGYLQGGLLIDFIGQKAAGPWISRLTFLCLDLMIAVFQLFGFACLKEVSRCESAESASASATELGRLVQIIMERRLRQENVERAAEVGNEDGIELEPLRRSEDDADGDSSNAYRAVSPAQVLDELNAGTALLIEFQPVQLLKDCFWELRHRNRGRV